MSQTRVTEFFSTRKRNRFQDESTLAKSKVLSQPQQAAHVDEVTDASPTKRCLRSSTRHQKAPTEKQVIELNEKEAGGKQGGGQKKSEKKEKIDQLKARIQRFEANHAKIIVEEKKEEVAPLPVKPVEKKKINKEELKKRIEEFNRNLAQIQVEPAKAAEKEEEISTAKNQNQPAPEILPAYEKLKSLATSDVESTALALPKSYSLLFDYFKGSDAIVKFLFDRDEVCTFLKLKMGIQNITKRTFTHRQLAQIKAVYPQSYLFKYEKLFIDFKNDYHFIISPNLQEIETNPKTGLKQFTPKVLLDRIGKFKNNLMAIVKKLHSEFLESIGIKDFNSDSLRRWHPKFDLENVKEIEEAELPKPPVDDSIKCKTGKELLDIARDIYSSRIQDAIKKSVADQPPAVQKEESKKEESEKGEKKTAASNSIAITVEVTVEEKKGSTQFSTLLEKIRNKEKQKAFETMVIKNDEKDKAIVKYRACTEATRFIVNFFQSEKKSTLELDKVIRKMSESMKTNTMNEFECRELINEMAGEESVFSKANKKWLNFIKVRGQTYLQIDKSMQLNDLIGICEGAVASLN